MAARRVVPVPNEINALVGPTGTKGGIDNSQEYPATSNENRSAKFSDFAKPAHKAMSRTLGYCLTLGSREAWSSFQSVASMRLDPTERGALAAAALNLVSEAIAERIAADVLKAAGAPLPAFLGGMDDARFWASMASKSELKAYALAAYEAMNDTDQAAFMHHIGSREVAA